jgi:hypothetical protein
MELIEQIKLLYPKFGTVKTAKILKVRQTTVKKIVDENKLIKNRRIIIEDFYNIQKKKFHIYSDYYGQMDIYQKEIIIYA